MRATRSFILEIGHLLLSVASAVTGNHWHRLTPQAMLHDYQMPAEQCVSSNLLDKLGNHLRLAAMLVDLSTQAWRRCICHVDMDALFVRILIVKYRLSVAYLVGPVRSLDIDRPTYVRYGRCEAVSCVPLAWRLGRLDRRTPTEILSCRMRMLDDSLVYNRGREWAC
jgi:hypothetical protein